jgi:iron complex outermembrane receptor protein
MCNPGEVFSLDGNNLPGLNSQYAAVPAGYRGKPTIPEFQGTAGTLNACSLEAHVSLIPATHRTGIFAEGNFELTPSIELFTELLYSHVVEDVLSGYPGLFGLPGFQSFTVSAANPYNPFGTTVGVTDLFTSLPRQGFLLDTEFFRPLLGVRGDISRKWQWELAAWSSDDTTRERLPLSVVDNVGLQNALNSSDPTAALNPFISGPPGQQALLQSFYSDGLSKFSGRRLEYRSWQIVQTPKLPTS